MLWTSHSASQGARHLAEQNLNGRLHQIVDELVRRGVTLEQARREFERQFIVASLKSNQGNFCRSARSLGVHRNTLRNKVCDLGILSEDYDLPGRRPARRRAIQRLGPALRPHVLSAAAPGTRSGTDLATFIFTIRVPPTAQDGCARSSVDAMRPWALPISGGARRRGDMPPWKRPRMNQRKIYSRKTNPQDSRAQARIDSCSLITLAAVLFLAITFDPSPSDSAPTDPTLRPRVDEATQTRDLERFLVAGTHAAGGSDSSCGGFHDFRSSDLDAAVAAASPASSLAAHRLSLFDPGPDVERGDGSCTIPYGAAIALAAERNHVDGLLLAAIVDVESGFSPAPSRPRARSASCRSSPSRRGLRRQDRSPRSLRQPGGREPLRGRPDRGLQRRPGAGPRGLQRGPGRVTATRGCPLTPRRATTSSRCSPSMPSTTARPERARRWPLRSHPVGARAGAADGVVPRKRRGKCDK